MKRAARAWLAAALWIGGCDGPVSMGDGGIDDAAIGDAGSLDAGADAATMPQTDAGRSGCDQECAEGQACVRGVCIADCGVDAAALESALGEGLTPIANFCRPANAYAVREEAGELNVWDLTVASEGAITTFTISRWHLDAGASEPSPTRLVSVDVESDEPELLVFPGAYLALDPEGRRAIFGFTTSAEGALGEVHRVDLETGESRAFDAPGNFDAAWLDAERFVVNGAGLGELAEGQGLYVGTEEGIVHHVGTDLGAYSGSVAVDASSILAAGVEEDFSSTARFLPRTRLEEALSAGTPVALGAEFEQVLDPQGAPIGSTFSRAGDRLVTTPWGGPLTSYAVAESDERWSLTDPRVLATGETFSDVLDAGEGKLLLVHGAGLLLVRD